MPTTCIVRVEDGKLISAETNYQGYIWDPKVTTCTPTGKRSVAKWKAVQQIFPSLVKGREFIDIGASFGFFCFKALECNASWVTGVERHKPYWQAIQDAPMHTAHFTWLCKRFPRETEHLHGDVVMCLSLIHHLFPSHSLYAILYYLREMTIEWLFIEWISPEDRAIVRKGWAEKHPEYNFGQFKTLARGLFSSMEPINPGHHATRYVYLLGK